MAQIITSFWQRLYRSIWLFPVICFGLVMLFTAFKISGSSVGIYHQLLYGKQKDPNLLLNQPRGVRSDEWLLNTQITIAQAKLGYPTNNPNIGQGQDMSLVVDVPTHNWSTLFKPQNLAFFVLPLEYAFAFKWWLLSCLLLISCYLFCLSQLPGRRLISSLIALSVLFSPFVQWWYQSSTLNCLSYGLLACLLIKMLVDNQFTAVKQKWLAAAALAYVAVCFGLILYPPFQISCGLVVLAFGAGYTLNQRAKIKYSSLLRLAGAGLAASLILAAFFWQHKPALAALQNTIYPGNRIVANGGYSPAQLLSYPFSVFLQSDSLAQHHSLNQSEASTVAAFSLPLVIIALVYAYRRWKNQHLIDWVTVSLGSLTTIFMIKLFMAHGNLLSKLLFLQKVPHQRLIIGFGLLNVLLLVKLIQGANKATLPPLVIRLSVLAWLGLHIVAGFKLRAGNPHFIPMASWVIILPALALLPLAWLGSPAKQTWALTLIVLFGVISTGRIHPLYRGLGLGTTSALTHQIAQQPAGTWVVSDFRAFEHIALVSGQRSLSGAYSYPQPKLWQDFGAMGDKELTYNRFAHVLFNLSPGSSRLDKIELAAEDYFVANSLPCSSVLRELQANYMISLSRLNSGCLKLQSKVQYPQATFYIYKRN